MDALANLAGVAVGLGCPVRLMAVLNVSPESFYAGSVLRDEAALGDAARRAVDEGADLVDVGAMSTAPYLATEIDPAEESSRMARAVAVVRAAVSVPISADTTRAAVALAAVENGASVLNDVSGLRADPAMAEIAARAAGVVLVASRRGAGDDRIAVADVEALLADSLSRARAAGVADERVVLDPGIGFFPGHRPAPEVFNCRLIDGLERFARLGRPLLVGVSRKSFIGTLTGRADAADRLPGSLAAAALAVYNGASVIRTHDVAATRDAVRIAEALRAERECS